MYYAVVDIGSAEFGPVNQWEFIFFFGTQIISSILMAIVFGDIAGLM